MVIVQLDQHIDWREERNGVTEGLSSAMHGPLAPGVLSPGLGGLKDYEASNLPNGVARNGKIAGNDIVEIVPVVDVANLTSQVCARLTVNLIRETAHRGQIGRTA